MKLTLMKGSFEKEDCLDLLQQMIEVKIKFHEKKVMKGENEEDIKMRERRIKELQSELMNARKQIEDQVGLTEIYSEIHIQ